MAWTAPRTWTAGETATAANFNTHIRDNLNWLANDKPRCSAVRTAVQSIPDSTTTVVLLNGTEEYDVGAMHDSGGANPERLTVPSGGGGLFSGIAIVQFATNGTGRRVLSLRKNGTAVSGYGAAMPADPGGTTTLSLGYDIPLVATDFLDLTCQQTSGGALNVSFARLTGRWVAF